MPDSPTILTTTVGSYPVPDWLSALPSKQALIDATRVVFDTQRQAGIDLPTDGELYRFDVNHPDCGLWMLKRSVADRKIAALDRGRDLYLGQSS